MVSRLATTPPLFLVPHTITSSASLGVVVRRSLLMLLTILDNRLGVGTVARVGLFAAEIRAFRRVRLRVELVVGCEHVDKP